VQEKKLSQLLEIFPSFNEKVNLISRKDISHLEEKHILHSLSILLCFDLDHPINILDVGTGGGFPGIPLAIMCPSARFTLVDSIGKKIKIVQDLIEKLDLQNCKAIHARAEKLTDKFNVITSRAVTNFPDFYNLAWDRISKKRKPGIPHGIIYLKGGDFEKEIKSFRKKAEVINLSQKITEPFFETKKIIYLPYF